MGTKLNNSSDRGAQKRFWAKLIAAKFLLISILVHVFFVVGAGIWVVQTIITKPKTEFKGGNAKGSQPMRVVERRYSLEKKRDVSRSTVQPKKITTSEFQKVSLPDAPIPTSMDEMSAGAMGAATGNLTGGVPGPMAGGAPGAGNATFSMFGFTGPSGSQGLVGTFYDLKQTRDRQPTDMTETPDEISAGESGMDSKWPDIKPMKRYESVLKDFVRSWDPKILSAYFIAPKHLTAYQIFIPYMKASEAPQAFGVENLCKGRRWVVHYKGKFLAPKDMTIRFIGEADDILVVRINGHNVLDGCWPTEEIVPAERSKDDVGPGAYTEPLIASNWITLRKGEVVPMEAIVGEGPGGNFSVFLMVQEKNSNDAPGDYPVFQLKDMPLPKDMKPGAGLETGSVPKNFTGKKMFFPSGSSILDLVK